MCVDVLVPLLDASLAVALTNHATADLIDLETVDLIDPESALDSAEMIVLTDQSLAMARKFVDARISLPIKLHLLKIRGGKSNQYFWSRCNLSILLDSVCVVLVTY